MGYHRELSCLVCSGIVKDSSSDSGLHSEDCKLMNLNCPDVYGLSLSNFMLCFGSGYFVAWYCN